MRFKFQLSICQALIVGKFQHAILNCYKNQAFFNYFRFKDSFLIHVVVCFTFRKYVTIIEYLCKYSNHCFLFLSTEYISYSAQYIFTRKYWQEYYTIIIIILMLSSKKVACANFDDSS